MVHVLQNDTWRVGVLPQTAASLAFAQIKRNGVWHDFMRPVAADKMDDALACASYLLVPWSNRIRDARFTFAGQAYQLRPSYPDGTAIHGAARHHPWHVVHADTTRIELRFDSRQHRDVNFPFAFVAWVEYVLEGTNFSTRLGVQNVDERPMPAGFGTHPMLLRALTAPDDLLELQLPFAKAYPLTDCLPTGEPVPVDDRLDYRTRRVAGQIFVDDCYHERDIGAHIQLYYAKSDTSVCHWMDHAYSHAVVYMPPGQPLIALEPVTNGNDGFNLMAQGAQAHGVFVLAPGAAREAMSGYVVS